MTGEPPFDLGAVGKLRLDGDVGFLEQKDALMARDETLDAFQRERIRRSDSKERDREVPPRASPSRTDAHACSRRDDSERAGAVLVISALARHLLH